MRRSGRRERVSSMSASRRSVASRPAGRRVAARRLAALAAAGVLAVAALAGCRVETSADAAYVGGTRYSVSDVNTTLAAYRKSHPSTTPAQLASIRREVAADLVFVDVAKRYAADKGYPAPQVSYANEAHVTGLPDSDPLVRVLAEKDAYLNLLMTRTAPATVTEADYRDIFNRALAGGLVQPGSFQQVVAQLTQVPSIAPAIAVRDALTGAMKRYGVEVNPRYQPMEVPLSTLVDNSTGRRFVAVGVPLGSGTPVSDAPLPATPDGSINQ